MSCRDSLTRLIEAANPSREKRELVEAIVDVLDALDGRISALEGERQASSFTQTPMSEFKDHWARERETK